MRPHPGGLPGPCRRVRGPDAVEVEPQPRQRLRPPRRAVRGRQRPGVPGSVPAPQRGPDHHHTRRGVRLRVGQPDRRQRPLRQHQHLDQIAPVGRRHVGEVLPVGVPGREFGQPLVTTQPRGRRVVPPLAGRLAGRAQLVAPGDRIHGLREPPLPAQQQPEVAVGLGHLRVDREAPAEGGLGPGRVAQLPPRVPQVVPHRGVVRPPADDPLQPGRGRPVVPGVLVHRQELPRPLDVVRLQRGQSDQVIPLGEGVLGRRPEVDLVAAGRHRQPGLVPGRVG